MPGTYTLVIGLEGSIELSVGALGECQFPAGGYAYTGSAFGAGGWARIDRHRRIECGEHDVRHWHIDYLLGHARSSIRTVVRTDDRDIECAVARRLPEGPVGGFGASDCDCPSHLGYAPDTESIGQATREAHEAALNSSSM